MGQSLDKNWKRWTNTGQRLNKTEQAWKKTGERLQWLYKFGTKTGQILDKNLGKDSWNKQGKELENIFDKDLTMI